MEAASRLSEYKLLVADDSQTTRRVVELAFAGSVFRVIAVPDGRDAIRQIEVELPDVVLLDTEMPERDGYEVSAFIKTTPHLVHIPVVLLAGAFDPIDDARVIQSKCDAVIVKPCLPEMLIVRVESLLGVSTAGSVPEPVSTSVGQCLPAADSLERGMTVEPDQTVRPGADGASTDRGTPDDDGRFEGPDWTYEMSEGPTARDQAETHGAAQDRPEEVLEPVARPDDVVDPGVAHSVRREDQQRQWAAQLEEALTRFDREPAEPGDQQDLPLQGGPQPAGSAAAIPSAPSARGPLEFSPEASQSPLAAAGEEAADRAPAAYSALTLSDALLEEIVRRVMERFTDRAVRELAGDVGRRLAERLVREEIDRMQPFAADAVPDSDLRSVPRVPLARRR